MFRTNNRENGKYIEFSSTVEVTYTYTHTHTFIYLTLQYSINEFSVKSNLEHVKYDYKCYW
jgi:hypothetical protein